MADVDPVVEMEDPEDAAEEPPVVEEVADVDALDPTLLMLEVDPVVAEAVDETEDEVLEVAPPPTVAEDPAVEADWLDDPGADVPELPAAEPVVEAERDVPAEVAPVGRVLEAPELREPDRVLLLAEEVEVDRPAELEVPLARDAVLTSDADDVPVVPRPVAEADVPTVDPDVAPPRDAPVDAAPVEDARAEVATPVWEEPNVLAPVVAELLVVLIEVVPEPPLAALAELADGPAEDGAPVAREDVALDEAVDPCEVAELALAPVELALAAAEEPAAEARVELAVELELPVTWAPLLPLVAAAAVTPVMG